MLQGIGKMRQVIGCCGQQACYLMRFSRVFEVILWKVVAITKTVSQSLYIEAWSIATYMCICCYFLLKFEMI